MINEVMIQEADIVQLKSGGPNMTVSWVQEHAKGCHIHTRWFDDYGICHEGSFRESMIKFISV